jgi:hypothetical protein
MGIACHCEAIGRRFRCRKVRREPIVACRNNACCGVEAAELAAPHIAPAVGLRLEEKGQSVWWRQSRTSQTGRLPAFSGAKLNVQTNT